jgi:hypothetical protein
MRRSLARATALLLAGSSLAIAEPSSDNETLVVVLEKQAGMREVHSQPITPDGCYAMQQLFRELNQRGQPLMLTTLRGRAEALTIFCVQSDGSSVDWRGAALTSEQIQHFAYELIAERQKKDGVEGIVVPWLRRSDGVGFNQINPACTTDACGTKITTSSH